MAKGMRLAAAVLALVFLLTGCSLFGGNVNDLLRAPALGAGLAEIQKALAAYLQGREPAYKYPKEGGERSPILRGDLDGDGREEAVLLYTLTDTAAGQDKTNNVYVAVLKQAEGEWQVVQDVQGLATDVASFEMVDLLGDGSRQLIVGYATANLNAKTFVLYTYADELLEKLYQFDYSRYAVNDFTGRGGNDLVVVSRDDQLGGLTLHYIPTLNGQFVPELEAVKLDANFVSCTGILPSRGQAGERVLVVDGVTATESGSLASQIIYYSGERFYAVDDFGALRSATVRINALLHSRDIDEDGVVEIPLRVGTGEIVTLAGDKRMEYVEWMDFITSDAPISKQFGLLDSDRAVYIRLPEEWRGQVEVVDGAQKGEWRLQNRRTMSTLLTMRVLEAGETPPLGAQRVYGNTSSYLVYHAALKEDERRLIQMTSMV